MKGARTHGDAWARVVAAAVTLAGLGCGDDGTTALLLDISSSHRVPEEVDGLALRAEGVDSGALLERSMTLRQPFPHTYAVLPAEDSGEEVTIEVTARKGATVVSQTRADARFIAGETRRVLIRLGAAADGGMPDGSAEPDGGGGPDGGSDPDGGDGADGGPGADGSGTGDAGPVDGAMPANGG